MDKGGLTGQIAIVTGGGRGLGQAIAVALAEAGAVVVVAARSATQLMETVTLIEDHGGCALSFEVDVTDQGTVERMVAEVEQTLGAVDLLINNAGVITPLGPIWEVDADAWWRCLEINLRGPFLCTRAVLPGMIAHRRGRILNMASAAGLGPVLNGSAYVASKTALIRFTENVSIETQAFGIATFAVEPGTVRTAMTEYLYGSEAGQTWTPWFRRIFDEGIDNPMEEVTRLILFLASGHADSLSGCMISVSDDTAELLNRAETIKEESLYTLKLCMLPS